MSEFPSFLQLNSISLYAQSKQTTFGLPIHECTSIRSSLCFLLDVLLETELLDHMVSTLMLVTVSYLRALKAQKVTNLFVLLLK